MSLFNMMLSGGGSEGFKTATPSSATASKLSFVVENEPQEYILLLTTSSASKPSNPSLFLIGFIAYLSDLDIGCVYGGFSYGQFTVGTSATYATASYSSEGFALARVNSTNRFSTSSDDTYILYYR